jgi:hypothetical protein
MFLQFARVFILRAEKENGYSDFALILGLVLAWAKADFLLFTSKIVEHSRHLPLTKCETEPLRRAFTCTGYLGHPFKKQALRDGERTSFPACKHGRVGVQSEVVNSLFMLD